MVILCEFSGALEDLFDLFSAFCKGLYESADPGFRGRGENEAEVVPLINSGLKCSPAAVWWPTVNIITCHNPETHKTSFL